MNPFVESIVVAAADDTPCGADWEQYKDEHCYKLLDNVGLQSYSNAENVCQTNNATLVSIHYAEEQNFLSNYIFTKKKAVDNVWIGAKFVGNKLYQWADHTTVSTKNGFTNWAAGCPKNLTDFCVEMHADVGSVGKWVDEPCAKKNLVLCQKTPAASLKLIAETMIELKHSLQQTASRLVAAERELEQLKNESASAIPIGFTYVQLPKDKAPAELWPSMTWTEVSSDYEGVFFRVAGGDAADFGETQAATAPQLETVHVGDTAHKVNPDQKNLAYNHNLTIPGTGEWSDAIVSGCYYSTPLYMSFKHSEGVEVRPKNMAIKVFRRTA